MGWGRGKKRPAFLNLSHISYNDETFHRKPANFAISRNTDIDCILIHNFSLTFFECLKIIMIKMVTVLMMSAKVGTLVLLKIKVLKNKRYDVINYQSLAFL